jgi:hypothetical protein
MAGLLAKFRREIPIFIGGEILLASWDINLYNKISYEYLL